MPIAPPVRELRRPILAMDTKTSSSPNYSSDLNHISYEISGQWGLVRLCSLSGSAPKIKRMGWQSTPKSGVFFQNLLVIHYLAKGAEIDMGTFGTCLDGSLCSTWRLLSGRAVLLFWQWTKKIMSSSQTLCLILIKFGISHQGNEALSNFVFIISRPLTRVFRTFHPQIRHFLQKKFFVRNYRAKGAEIDAGANGSMSRFSVLLYMTISSPVRRLKGVFLFWQWTQTVFQTTGANRTKFTMEHQVDEFYWDFAHDLGPPLWAISVYPQIRYFLQKSYCQKLTCRERCNWCWILYHV